MRAHQRSVYSLALRMLGNRELAEDLAQEVFLQLHRNLARIESQAHLASWLRRVTVNRAIDRLRQPRLETVLLDEEIALSDTREEDPVFQRRLASLLGHLAPSSRAVLLLRYQEDLDPLEIAGMLEMPLNTVKSHLHRALALLRERLMGSESETRRNAPDSRPQES